MHKSLGNVSGRKHLVARSAFAIRHIAACPPVFHTTGCDRASVVQKKKKEAEKKKKEEQEGNVFLNADEQVRC